MRARSLVLWIAPLCLALFWYLRPPTPVQVVAPEAQPSEASPVAAPPPTATKIDLPSENSAPPLDPPPKLGSLDDAFCDPPGEERRLVRSSPDVTYALKARHTADYVAARAALDRHLAKAPNDARLARIRELLVTQEDVQRGFERMSDQGIVLDYPPDVMREGAARVALFEIRTALEDAARLTGTTRRSELYAVVYRDNSEILAVTCAPAWSRAVYDGTLRVMVENGTTRTHDVRHEAMHAQLGPLIGGQPKWFHEGVANYLGSRGRLRWRNSFDLMLANRTYVPFASLDGSFWDLDADEDAGLVYAESEAMVHLLVERGGQDAIARAVAMLKDGKPSSELARALELHEVDLLEMLARRKKKPTLKD